MDWWMDNATGSLLCLSPISFPLSLETNPTSVGLRVHSFTQSQAHTTMCSLAFNNKHGMSTKMRILHIGNYRVNQITITPFPWSMMHTTRLRDNKQHPALIFRPTEKFSLSLVKKIYIFGGAPSYWSTLFLFVWQAIMSSNNSALRESSWFQLSETGPWTKTLSIALMDLTVPVQSAFFFPSQEIFYQPHSPVLGL